METRLTLRPGMLGVNVQRKAKRMSARQTDFLLLVAIALWVALPAVSLAAEGQATPEPWYKVIAGIMAIPASIIGLAVSYRLFRKTNLESRKLELEIGEKEKQLQNTASTAGIEALRGLAQPLALSQRLSILILRFVILDLTLRIWHFVPAAIGYITAAAVYSTFFFLDGKALTNLDPLSPSGAAIFVGPALFRLLFDIVDWFIILGFGWPILRDACAILGIRITGLLDLPFLGRRGQHPNDT